MIFSVTCVVASPSGGQWPAKFEKKGEWWYDKPWGVNRNSAYNGSINEKGYVPTLAYESTHPNIEQAYLMGKWFESNYPSKYQRAEAILRWVQKWTQYGYDSDYVTMDGEPQEEWAWNPDEMMHLIDTSISALAIGDCEDIAFLCAVLYMGAGFGVAIVDAQDHVALLIHFPEYPKANMYWNIGEAYFAPQQVLKSYGWIWVEATGDNNPLGWTPPEFIHGGWEAHPLTLEIDMRIIYGIINGLFSHPGSPKYNPDYDFNDDARINIYELYKAMQYFTKWMPLRFLPSGFETPK